MLVFFVFFSFVDSASARNSALVDWSCFLEISFLSSFACVPVGSVLTSGVDHFNDDLTNEE